MKKTALIFLFLFYNILAHCQSATLLKDITPRLTNFLSEPNNLTTINAILFFTVRDTDNSLEALWKSDRTVNGTLLFKIFPDGGGCDQFTNVNGILYFVLNYFNTGQQLWKSDGATNGTTLVKTFASETSVHFNLVNLNGTLIYSNYELATGFELWKTDGFAAETFILKDVNPSNILTTYPYYSTNINVKLFFGEDDGTNGLAL